MNWSGLFLVMAVFGGIGLLMAWQEQAVRSPTGTHKRLWGERVGSVGALGYVALIVVVLVVGFVLSL